MAKRKIVVGVLFGGRSGEHEVSIVSGQNVINALNKDKYQVIPIGITKEGKWISGADTVKILKSGVKHELPLLQKVIIPDATQRCLVPIQVKKPIEIAKQEKLDVIIPILHGPYGEDGTVQGLLELANIPYVGAGVLGSAVGMDKIVNKTLFKEAGLPVVKFIHFTNHEWKKNKSKIIKDIDRKLGFPCFTKPANLGSSVGISKVLSKKWLVKGIKEALSYDRRVIVEEGIEKVREIEISVLGNEDLKVSQPGEIIPSRSFYDYNAKYIDDASQSIIPAEIPLKTISEVKKIAKKAFKITDCAGMARVDFLVTRKTNEIYLSEINTIPGFTFISMYPKLWEDSGISYPKLIEKLIKLAFERHRKKSKLATSYKVKGTWFK